MRAKARDRGARPESRKRSGVLAEYHGRPGHLTRIGGRDCRGVGWQRWWHFALRLESFLVAALQDMPEPRRDGKRDEW